MSNESTRGIAEARFESRFVDGLPADPRTDLAPRQVLEACYSRVTPTPVRAPACVALVPEVARMLDLRPEITDELTSVLAGNLVLPGMKPYAACYGGHQFGNWAGQLGDGRAITLTEIVNARGERLEVQLKGAGPTPYSRRADGRAVLRSSLRELVASEAMHALGIPTTRALSLVLTGEDVERDILYDGHPELEPGAITCRVAPSFLRFGSYEIHAARGDASTLEKLVRYTLETFYPDFVAGEAMDIPGFFREVARRTARMVVGFMRVGFVHGVMNTDNMSILGLSIDYGPFGFLESFDPRFTPNTTDAHGRRYRYGQQPRVAHWNLVQLANALVPLVPDVSGLERALEEFGMELETLQRGMLLSKLGLTPRPHTVDDDALLEACFGAMMLTETDMTLFYRGLAALPLTEEVTPSVIGATLADAFYAGDAVPDEAIAKLATWANAYRARVQEESISEDVRRARMDAVNPLYIPRNYLLHETIEAVRQGDFTVLAELMDVLRNPYTAQRGKERFAQKRPEWARNKPGCDMLSCSS